MNRPRDFEANDDAEEEAIERAPELEVRAPVITDLDLKQEQEEIRELERKKRGLEERVNSMGRDISGVLR